LDNKIEVRVQSSKIERDEQVGDLIHQLVVNEGGQIRRVYTVGGRHRGKESQGYRTTTTARLARESDGETRKPYTAEVG